MTTPAPQWPQPEPESGASVPVPTVDHQARNGWLYWAVKPVLTPVLTLAFRPTVTGITNVPRKGAALLAANHTSYLDWLMLPLVVRFRRISFLAKMEYFTGTSVRGRAQKFFFSGTGQVPVDRRGADAATASLRVATELLAEGRIVGVFPEGTRTRDGRLNRGRTGVARMAAASGVPIIPVAVVGLFEAARPGRRFPRPVKTAVRFGRPMRPIASDATQEDLRLWTDELMGRIAEMSGQEQSGVNAVTGSS